MMGSREPNLYGSTTLAEINDALSQLGQTMSVEIECFQSNSEAEIIDYLHQSSKRGFAGIVINAAAFTHTSIALRDALLVCGLPFVEVHISNTFKRESFRHKSYLADLASGVVIGFGPKSYTLALRGLVETLTDNPQLQSGHKL